MPIQSSVSLTSHGNFDLVKRLKLDFTDVEVSKWRSRITGLSVVHVDYEAPIVDGYFAVGTEIFDDSGCPHTLEHLVFMGSQRYPYKGIIDNLANRGFSNGTNAWTDTDHTVYTVSTAGGQGFLQLLPIYVDHILYPTLTKASFLTEVHHIDSKGHDSGVVYSEMQGRENTSPDLMALRLQRLVNSHESAYRSETGGLMEALRSLTIDQIREYHSTYYVPHNLSLIVTGKLTNGTKSLLSVVQDEIEPNLIAHGQDKGARPPGWKRPFLETPSANRLPISESAEATVEFPEKDESVGELMIGFMGPAPDQYLERKALDIIGTYLTSSPVAPLNKEFVEIEHPLCSYIYFGEDIRATLVDLPVYVGSVPIEHVDSFEKKLKYSLERIIKEGIDLERMAMVINRDRRQLRSRLESAKGDTFSGSIIVDFLLGPEDGSGMLPALDEMTGYDILKKFSSDQWIALIKRYYIDPPSIVIRGKPSAALAERLDKDEKSRIAAQVQNLGTEGLAKAGKELEEAKEEHDKPIPSDVFKRFPVPDVNSISWIPVQSAQEGAEDKMSTSNVSGADISQLKQHINADGSPLPFFVQFDHVQSDFVSVHALLSLATVPDRLRPLVSAYMSSFFSLPVRRSSGERLAHDEVVHKLDDDTVSYDTGLGISSYFPEIFCVSIKVETNMYPSAVEWLRDLIYGAEFDKERLQVALAKIQQTMPELKRDGQTVLSSVSSDLLYDANSTSRANGVLAQIDAVPKYIKQLQESPEALLRDFEEIRKHITDPSGMRFSVTGNVLALAKPRSVWADSFGRTLTEKKELHSVPLCHETLSRVGQNPMKKAVVVSLPTIESSYTAHTTKGIRGFDHPDYPAQRVAREILNATESFLWRYIRGSGLAYGASVSLDDEAGLLSFSLYRSSNAMQAFQEAAKVVQGLVDGSIPLNDTALDAAKSSIVYNVTKNVATPSRAAIVSFTNQALKNVSQDHNVELLERFQAVTKEDVLAALKTSFLPLFNPESSVAVIVTAPGKADSIGDELKGLGFEVEKRTLEIDADELDGEREIESGSEDGSESDSSGSR